MAKNDSGTRGIHAQIAIMARSLHNTVDGDFSMPDDILREITATAVRIIPGADHAGITLITNDAPRLVVASVAATGPTSAKIDQLQEAFSAGPSLSSIRTKLTVRVDDFTTDTRWPELAAAIEHTSVRSSLSSQLYTDHTELGALNLYSEHAATFTDDLIDHAAALAAHGALALSSARRSQQFRSALASRDIIGQAKGMLMERYNLDATHAFRLLARLSQNENIKLADLAHQLITIDHPTQT